MVVFPHDEILCHHEKGHSRAVCSDLRDLYIKLKSEAQTVYKHFNNIYLWRHMEFVSSTTNKKQLAIGLPLGRGTRSSYESLFILYLSVFLEFSNTAFL